MTGDVMRQSANIIDVREDVVPLLLVIAWLVPPLLAAVGVFLVTSTWRQCFGLWCLLAAAFAMFPG